MPQPRDRAGQYARHTGIGLQLGPHLDPFSSNRNIDLKGDPMPKEVIAKEDVIVHDPNLEIDRKIVAGLPVPPDLVGPYLEKIGEGAEREEPDAAERQEPDAVERVENAEAGSDVEKPAVARARGKSQS